MVFGTDHYPTIIIAAKSKYDPLGSLHMEFHNPNISMHQSPTSMVLVVS